ncbi:uncharacterized protein BJX67DRAFT_342192 [Aspergillus lucknowensis]|uniref:Uncharacterized protein n=1 Tax=Aspergillus lucknowensis TaxID=176173 RepID=A0ABR4M491_9EURO
MVSLGGGIRDEREVSREVSYTGRVIGSVDLRGRNSGKPNCASWTVFENPATQAGVPVALTTAILLKRQDEGLFQAVVTMRARADWRTQLEWLVGRTPADDPVLFDPTLALTSDRYQEQELNMESIKLEEIYAIRTATMVEGGVQAQKQSASVLT